MKFNSQIATSRSQSERLLALGLKKETADCGHSWERYEHEESEGWETMMLDDDWPYYWDVTDKEIPAWSLNRLIGMIQDNQSRITMVHSWVHIENHIPYVDCRSDSEDNLYDNLINCIEWLIKEGYFNNEYLV